MGFTSGLMYFGYMFLASYAFAVGTGTIGFVSSFVFVRVRRPPPRLYNVVCSCDNSLGASRPPNEWWRASVCRGCRPSACRQSTLRSRCVSMGPHPVPDPFLTCSDVLMVPFLYR